MIVKNLNGTSDNPKCPCGSWIRHWENYAGKSSDVCVAHGCYEEAEVGAHVQKESGDQSWYIIPLCAGHNNLRGQKIDILNNAYLAPAAARNKCG